MNKPIPAIDENGEFVVATQRNGEQVIIYTLHSDADQIVGECRWWHLDGSSICRSKPGYDLIDLDKVRATVKRARKMQEERNLDWKAGESERLAQEYGSTDSTLTNQHARAAPPKVHYDADGAASTDSRSAADAVLRNHIPRRPSFAEALYKIIDNAPPEHNSLAPVTWGGLIAIIKRARRASEGE